MNINQATQGNNPDASGNIPAKRKRGRPRKYPKLNSEDNARIPKIQRMNWEGNAGGGVPPGFGGVNGNQPRQVATSNDAANSMVGKAVSGVIEAVFDAGYLLNVRVANSDTTLRGVVFRPGRFVPVSAENDVAPNVQMIRRNEVPLPTEHYNPRPRERKEQQVTPRSDGTHSFGEPQVANQVPRATSYSANNVASKGKQVPLVAVQTAHPDEVIPRGNLVAVVLEPTKVSNGLPLVNEPTPLATQTSHATASKGKQPQEGVPSNGSISTTQEPTFGSEAVLSQPQTSHQLMSEVAQNENGCCNQPSVETAEAKSMRMPAMPFENLVTEVIKRIESPSQPAEDRAADSKPADKTLVKDEDETNDVDQALDVEPLRAVLLNDDNNKPTSPKPIEDARTSKMSQLLEGTVTESPVLQTVTPKLNETQSLATEQGDKETQASIV